MSTTVNAWVKNLVHSSNFQIEMIFSQQFKVSALADKQPLAIADTTNNVTQHILSPPPVISFNGLHIRVTTGGNETSGGGAVLVNYMRFARKENGT